LFKLLDIEILLLFSSFITFVLVIWFNTSAVVEYGKLLKLDGVLFIKEYEDYVLNIDIDATYITFLACTKDNFIIRLITCPLCLSLWYSLSISLVIGLIYICPLYLLSLMAYFIFTKLSKA